MSLTEVDIHAYKRQQPQKLSLSLVRIACHAHKLGAGPVVRGPIADKKLIDRLKKTTKKDQKIEEKN